MLKTLLAAYNPETGATGAATDRLLLYPAPYCGLHGGGGVSGDTNSARYPQRTDDTQSFGMKRLRYLFDYAKAFDDASQWFDSREADEVVHTNFRVENPWIRRSGRVRFQWVPCTN